MAALVPVVIAALAGSIRVAETKVDLDATATEAAYVSAKEEAVTELLLLSELDAGGLTSIQLPRTRESAERLVSTTDGRAVAIRVTTAAGSTGAVTLPPLVLAEGGSIAFDRGDPKRLRLSIAASTLPITLNVQGTLQVTLPGEDPQLINFGAPKPIVLEPAQAGSELHLGIRDDSPRLLGANVPVNDLSFLRVNRTVETARNQVTATSTIVSARLRQDRLWRRERTVTPADQLRFGGIRGDVRAAELVDGGLRVQFQGTAQRLDACGVATVCHVDADLPRFGCGTPHWLDSCSLRRLFALLGSGRSAVDQNSSMMTSARQIAVCLGALLVYCAATSAQSDARADEPGELIKSLIVRIDTDSEFGAGIVVGVAPETLYIATANHVVRRGTREAGRIQVQFAWQSAKEAVPAKLLPQRDEAMDLAVLSVSGLKNISAGDVSLPLDRLGDPEALGRSDPIFLMGHPNGFPWRVNATPERFTRAREQMLEFESNLLAKGHSGGALLNDDDELIGMLRSDSPPYGEALNIYAIARKFDLWNLPVSLRLPAARVSAGDQRTCVLSPRGKTECWGYDDRFQPGPLTMGDVRLRTLSTGADHACGLAPHGAAFCIGSNRHGQLGDGSTSSQYETPAPVSGGLEFRSISAGFGFTCGVTRGGAVFCWGAGSEGRLGARLPNGSLTPSRVALTERFTSVSAGSFYGCALTVAGAAFCWGSVGAAEMLTDLPARRFARKLSFVSLTTGYSHACGLTAAGAAWCWGFNTKGNLGDGTTSRGFVEEPVQVSGNYRFSSLTAGVSHTCGIASGGKAYCWGLNNFGQLGNGTQTDSAVPSGVSGAHTFDNLSAGHLHTCGVTTEGVVLCWGNSERGAVSASSEKMHATPLKVMTVPGDERLPWREKTREVSRIAGRELLSVHYSPYARLRSQVLG